MKFSTAITRALRLKCPQCGEADIADGWLSTQPSCSACGADLAVETGYFLGAIYFNYGATVLITLSAAIPLIFVAKLPTMPVVGAAMIFCVAFPLWFFRYARSLWLATDHYYHVRRRDSVDTTSAQRRETPDLPCSENRDINCICPLCHSRFQVNASRSKTWGKCPNCYGDVLLLPAPAVVGHDIDSREQNEFASEQPRQMAS